VHLAGSALLLTKDKNVYKQHIRIFPLACQFGLDDLVFELLNFPVEDIVPEAFNNFAIRKSSENGHDRIVNRLLQIPSVDPTADNQYALRRACANGHKLTVIALFSHPSINPITQSHSAFCIAVTHGHTELVKLLLNYYDPTLNNCETITWACTSPHVDVMKVLQSCPGFSVNCRNNYAIQWASRTGQLKMVQYLVTCPGVDPTVNNNYAIYWAKRNGHYEVEEFLKTLPGVDYPEKTPAEPGENSAKK